MTEQVTLGYWDIRGLAHAIRLLLKAADADFVDVTYEETNRETWYQVKPTLDLPLPNLPYLIDGDVKVTQSLAILRYLGRKHSMAPISEEDKVKCEVLELQLMDWTMEAFKLWATNADEYEEKKTVYEETIDNKIQLLEKYIQSGPFVLGDQLTYVDFLLYQFLDYQRRFIPALLASSPNLQELMKQIESIDQVKSYLESDEAERINFITGSHANWGNRSVPNHLDVE